LKNLWGHKLWLPSRPQQNLGRPILPEVLCWGYRWLAVSLQWGAASNSSLSTTLVLLPILQAAFLALNKIWDNQYCRKCYVGGIDGWQCLRYGEQFKPVHHTRVVTHFAKIPNRGIQVCSAAIPEMELKGYVDLWTICCKRKTELTMAKI
jgi:hypothetical protein